MGGTLDITEHGFLLPAVGPYTCDRRASRVEAEQAEHDTDRKLGLEPEQAGER